MQVVVLMFFLICNRAVLCAYFTMRDIEITLTHDKKNLPSRNHPLATLYAQGNDKHLRYSINGTHGYLEINASTGDIFLTNKFFESNLTALNEIVATVSVEDSDGERDWTTFKVNIFPTNHTVCEYFEENLCYWTKVNYRLKETQKATIIGPLTSSYITEMCPTYQLKYQIKTDTNVFELVPPSDANKFWSIAASAPLERERQTNTVDIRCTIVDTSGTIKEIDKNDVFIEILDDDNHPPVPQDEEIHVKMHSNFVNKGHVVEYDHIIFTDKDPPSVNHYEAHVVSNDNAIDNNLLQPNCTKYPDTRDEKNQTAIHCKLIFTRNIQFRNATTHTIVLQLNDTTLKNANTSSTAHLPIHLNFFNKPLELKQISNRPLLLYPQHEVKVFRTAGPLARITQPKHYCKDCSNFTITELPNRKDIFRITEDGDQQGIVFVHDIMKLRNASEYVRLNITWMKKKERLKYDEIQIRIVGESSPTCLNVGGKIREWTFCSEFKTYNECTKSTVCAISTGGSASLLHRENRERCMWRGDKNPGPNKTHLYSTCTPDKTTCPDGVCDSLEILNDLICPQDCSTNILFPTKKNPKTHRGIDEAAGIVSCNKLGGCKSDIPKIKDAKKKVETIKLATPALVEPNVSRHIRNITSDGKILGIELSKCGTSCIFGIVGGTLFLGGAVALIVVCWRLDRVNKAVQGKYNDENQDIVAPLSDYVDRNVNSEPFPLSFHMTTNFIDNTTLNIIKKYEPDPKWEFPRSQLVIEQTLGEGEFGRVLRAKAMDIAGQPGYTTVAVKTLKDDARETELNDLLSEYQLLKEVSHPNVIRLLGVCTASGGPVYLIIEFAEHGSLRNYLRRSRHLKSDCGRLPSSSDAIDDGITTTQHYDEPIVAQVTPKEVLSFAWQICNGMAYLSDIKLVHRDLAARNVLLAADKICKISDFGLTRDIYEDNAYFKRSKGRVPVKWMAPESLADHIYTSKSDVWSFGILVWELVTLGATPYPGIAVQNLFHLLRQGYRMERPDNCSLALYKIMRKCWQWDAEKRPTFQQLANQWEQMLADGTEYLDLTNNAIHNRSYFCSPFEENDFMENDEEITDNNHLNYLSKSQSYEKCGASEKLINNDDENNTKQTTDNNQNINTEGYETPIKIQKKLQTPTNEWPQEYTDMEAGKMK